MSLLRTLVAVASATLLLGGCATQQTSTDSLAQPLAGEWQLKEVAEGGERWLLDDEVAIFTMTLDAPESRAFGQVACNRWNGPFRLEGERLIVGPSASTRARCHVEEERHKALERRYLGGLANSLRYQMVDGQLMIDLADGERWLFMRP